MKKYLSIILTVRCSVFEEVSLVIIRNIYIVLHDKVDLPLGLWGVGWALIRGWALINFTYLKGGRLFEVGAYSRLGAKSNKYGM